MVRTPPKYHHFQSQTRCQEERQPTFPICRLEANHCTGVSIASRPLDRDIPFAASKAAIVPKFGPISQPKDHADDKCLFLSAKSVHFLSQECCGECLRTTQRSSKRLLVEIVMFFAYRDRDTQTRRSNGGGTPNR